MIATLGTLGCSWFERSRILSNSDPPNYSSASSFYLTSVSSFWVKIWIGVFSNPSPVLLHKFVDFLQKVESQMQNSSEGYRVKTMKFALETKPFIVNGFVGLSKKDWRYLSSEEYIPNISSGWHGPWWEELRFRSLGRCQAFTFTLCFFSENKPSVLSACIFVQKQYVQS